MIINPKDLSASAIYHIITQTLIPRPIAWALTENKSGNFNLAPFSYFAGVSSAPPILMLSIGKKPDGTEKDTRINIKHSKKVVIHIAHGEQAHALNASSATKPYGDSEIEQLDLSLTMLENFSLPRLTDCYVAFGCELYEQLEIGDEQQAVFFVEVKTLYIADDKVSVTEKNRLKIDAHALNPIARLGGGEFSLIQKPFFLKRPK